MMETGNSRSGELPDTFSVTTSGAAEFSRTSHVMAWPARAVLGAQSIETGARPAFGAMARVMACGPAAPAMCIPCPGPGRTSRLAQFDVIVPADVVSVQSREETGDPEVFEFGRPRMLIMICIDVFDTPALR